MTEIFFHKNDLPPEIEFNESIAVDSETLGLRPERDPLCLVQLSSGDGNAHLVQLDRDNYNAPNLKKILTDKNCLKIFHFARFDVAVFKKYLNIDCLYAISSPTSSCASTVRCPIISPFAVFDVVVILSSSKTPVNDKPNPPEVTASAATSAVIVVVVFIRSYFL